MHLGPNRVKIGKICLFRQKMPICEKLVLKRKILPDTGK